MSDKSNSYLFFIPLLGLLGFQYFCLIQNEVLLADDLSKVYEGRHNSDDFFLFLRNFMSGTNMTSRPVSALFTGILIYLTKFSIYFYYCSYLFFIGSLFAIKKMLSSVIKNEWVENAMVIIYALIPIGTSIVYSPIMINSSLATIFFCFAVVTFVQNKNVILCSFLFILSFLSYEIFAPCIIFFLLINKGSFKKLMFFFGFTLGGIILYKKGIEPVIFSSYYQREELGTLFNFKKSYLNILFIAKLFLRDLPTGILKGILAARYFGFLDWLAIIIFNVLCMWGIMKSKLTIPKLRFYPFLIAFGFSLLIFFFSTYKPTIFGFDNRNLGAVRLLFVLVFIISLFKILHFFSIREKVIKYIFIFIIFVFSVVSLSVKNAWIYANSFNNQLFSKLKVSLPKDKEFTAIFIKYNMEIPKTNPHFIFREQVFYYPWESSLLKEKCHIPKNQPILLFEERNIRLYKEYYIFDWDTNTLKYIE